MGSCKHPWKKDCPNQDRTEDLYIDWVDCTRKTKEPCLQDEKEKEEQKVIKEILSELEPLPLRTKLNKSMSPTITKCSWEGHGHISLPFKMVKIDIKLTVLGDAINMKLTQEEENFLKEIETKIETKEKKENADGKL